MQTIPSAGRPPATSQTPMHEIYGDPRPIALRASANQERAT
jgi:hypothetical protein